MDDGGERLKGLECGPNVERMVPRSAIPDHRGFFCSTTLCLFSSPTASGITVFRSVEGMFASISMG